MPMCITVKGRRAGQRTYAFLPSRIFLIMEGALVSETVPCPSRFESPCSCSIVSVRSSRVRLNLWFCEVCTYAHAHGETAMARRACEWGEDSPWKGVSKESLMRAAGRHCGVTCATNACTAAVGRETNETHFCRRETVRGRLKVRLDHCQLATRRSSRWPRDFKHYDPHLVKVVYCQVVNKALLTLESLIRRLLHGSNLNVCLQQILNYRM